jgi:phosphate transport system protein
MPGFRGEFDRSLDDIESKVIELFALVTEDLPRASKSLLGEGDESARELADREQTMNALYVEAEVQASRAVLLQAPAAGDLRYLLSVLRITPELERSHDLIMQIAALPGLAGDGATARTRALTRHMSDLASAMWRRAADAWYQRDRTAADALTRRLMEMNEVYADLTAELASSGMPTPAVMDLTVVAHCYKRFSVHAVNIARRVSYLAGTAGNPPAWQ